MCVLQDNNAFLSNIPEQERFLPKFFAKRHRKGAHPAIFGQFESAPTCESVDALNISFIARV
jgi:hypothetical protein